MNRCFALGSASSRRHLIGGIALVCALVTTPAQAQVWRDAHEQAVQLWRGGDAAKSLSSLRELLTQFPAANPIRFDFIVVAQGAGNAQEALVAAQGVPLATLPAYALRPLFDAARATGDLTRAREVADELVRRAPPEKAADEQVALTHALLIAETQVIVADESRAAYRFRLDNVIDALAMSLPNASPDAQRRIAMDRVTLLARRERFRDALHALNALLASDAAIPGWFAAVAGDVFLSNRQPQRAVEFYRRAFADGVNSFGAQAGYFYALLELEQHDAAMAHVNDMVARITEPADAATTLRKQLLDARALYFTDRVEPAVAAIDRIMQIAADNRDARLLKAQVWRTRGLLHSSDTMLQQLLAEKGDDAAAMLSLADTRLRRNDRVGAQAWLTRARELEPESSAALRTAREHALNAAPMLSMEANFGRSSVDESAGRITPLPSRDHRLEAYAYLPWWEERVRAQVGVLEIAETKVQQTAPNRRIVSLGAEWAALDSSLLARAMVDNDARFGLSLKASTTLSDRWRVTAAVDRDGPGLPLRAWRAGTHATSVHAEVGYQFHARFNMELAGDVAHFSDGNRRRSVSLAVNRRLYGGPTLHVDARVDSYAQWNASADVPYYSPEHQRGVAVALTGEWLQWRVYERNLSHVLSVGVGVDWQKGQGAAPLVTARYQQRWNLSNCFQVSYGIEWLRRSYDGNPESRWGGFIALERRWV